ncbi:MAG: hypothetical protein P1P86_12330 [Bacteroidales bacterium]|nr:hypothetical protein [Bacteroidales bacterium]
MSKKRYDTLLSGLLPALAVPALSMLIIWIIKSEKGLADFLVSFQQLGMLSKLISLSALPNLLLFFICIWTKRNFAARGVIFSTLLLAFLMLLLKFV